MEVRSFDGTAIHVEVAGDGQPVLLIHGSAAPGQSWGPVVEELSREFRAIAIDRRAYGRSGGDPTPDNQVHAGDAAAVLRELGVPRAPVVGWSRGGSTALELALLEGDLVERLVLVEPVFRAPKHIDLGFVRRVIALQARKRVDPRGTVDRLMRWMSSRREGSSAWDDEAYGQERRDLVMANRRAILGEWTLRQPDRLTPERVATIAVPTVVLLGEQSLAWFEGMATDLVNSMPDARLVRVPGATHSFVYTAADAIVREVRAAIAAPLA